MPDARDCAELLLSTMPNLMRGLGGAMRQQRAGDDEPLSMGQLRMLDMLQHAPCSLSALASRHHVTPSTMSRTVDVLVRRNWVARNSAADDRRQIVLTLTDEGRAALGSMQQRMFDLVTQMVGQLSDDERARVYDGLSILRTLLDRARPLDAHDCRPPNEA